MLSKLLAGLVAVEIAEELHDVHHEVRKNCDRRVSSYSTPTPTRYVQGGYQPPTRGTYSVNRPTKVIYRETALCLSEMINACDGKLRSIGREIAYQCHRSEKSGWHNAYFCNSAIRQDIRRIAKECGVDDIRPHDADYRYERLADEILHYAKIAEVV